MAENWYGRNCVKNNSEKSFGEIAEVRTFSENEKYSIPIFDSITVI